MEATHKIEPALGKRIHGHGHVSLLFSWRECSQAVALREGQELVVGRAEPAELILDDHSLSRTHARLSLRDGCLSLEDLRSTNGCLLNGRRLSAATLGEDDLVQLGAVELRICMQAHRPSQKAGVSHASFMRALSDELTRARVFGRAVSVLALRQEQAASAEHELLQRRVQGALKPVDRFCSFAPTLSLVLLPEQDGPSAKGWLKDTGWPERGPHGVGVASYPALACTAEELVSRALDACHAARAGGMDDASAAPEVAARGPILHSACMRRLYDLVARAARTTMPVLVQGETGAGKELVARAVHDESLRKRGPFKALNCATIPTSLLESVLFGHERGAFTGASHQAAGIFEQAAGGTVFLDEVGELSLPAQAALLRVLEQHRIVRVGGTSEIEVDARVVAATHRNLAGMVQSGSFREDLMFRLDALTLLVPPLRERSEEIIPLAELFLARARAQWGASAQCLSDHACDALVAYRWPGNVRQLKNIIERAVVVCTGDTIDLPDLPDQVWKETSHASALMAPQTGAARADFSSLPCRVREFESRLIREAMERAGRNQAQAARILGLPRRTLANKLHAYGMRQEP